LLLKKIQGEASGEKSNVEVDKLAPVEMRKNA
jgi:hypothetical protein